MVSTIVIGPGIVSLSRRAVLARAQRTSSPWMEPAAAHGPGHGRHVRLVAVGADADRHHLREVDAVELLDEAPHEVPAGLLAVGDDVDAGLLLLAQGQEHRVALALLERRGPRGARAPTARSGRREPLGLGEAAGDGGVQHGRGRHGIMTAMIRQLVPPPLVARSDRVASSSAAAPSGTGSGTSRTSNYTADEFKRDRDGCTEEGQRARRGVHEADRGWVPLTSDRSRQHAQARRRRRVAPATSPRAVVFDFGGVLWDMRWDVARELDRAHGLPRSSVFETLYRLPAWADIECGVGDPAAWTDGAHRELERRAGRALPRLHDEWRKAQAPIEPNVALVRALRPPYRCSVLSNADVSLRGRLEGELALQHLFDDIVVSAEVGMAKPDARDLPARRRATRPAARGVRVRGRLGQERGGGARGRHDGGASPRRQGRRPPRAARRGRRERGRRPAWPAPRSS